MQTQHLTRRRIRTQEPGAKSQPSAFCLLPSAFHSPPRPSAFTLIELLMVIVILSIVTIATIPIVRPALDTRRIRESARMLAAQITEAQTRAVETGRPAGIWIERLRVGAAPSQTFEPGAAMEVFLCETPQPFSGSYTNSQVKVRLASGKASLEFPATEVTWHTLLKPGDLVRFNYSGAIYRFTGNTDVSGTPGTEEYPANSGNYILKRDNTLKFELVPVSTTDPTFRFPPAASTAAGWSTPYQILRQPTKLSTAPLQLPAQAAIDLFYSGVGGLTLYQRETNSLVTGTVLTPAEFLDNTPSGTSPDDARLNRLPLIITFNSSGALDKLYMRGQQYPLTQPLHLLVGKREKIQAANGSLTYALSDPRETQTEKHNFRDLENLWVSISPQTGLVSTTEMTEFDDSIVSGANDEVRLQDAIQRSRQFATSAQTMGGR